MPESYTDPVTGQVHPYQNSGAALIANERVRQVLEEGYTTAHDTGHEADLTTAAFAYLQYQAKQLRNPFAAPEQLGLDEHPIDYDCWPISWGRETWKPTGNPVRDLVKAGALIAAAIDSLQEQHPELAEPVQVAVTHEEVEAVENADGTVNRGSVDHEAFEKPWTPPTHFWGRAGVLNVETDDGRMITKLPQVVRGPVPLTTREGDHQIIVGRIEKIWINDESGLKAILFEGSFLQESRLRDDLWAGTYPQMTLSDLEWETQTSLTKGTDVLVTNASRLREVVLGDSPVWSNLFFRSGRAPEDVQPGPFTPQEGI